MVGTQPQTDQDYNQPASFIRRVHHSKERRTPYGTVQRRRHFINITVGKISIQFNGTANLQTPLLKVGAEPFSVCHGTSASPRAGNINPQSPPSLRYVPSTRVNEFAGGQIPAAGQGSSRAGYHQRTQNAGHTYVPESNIGPAPFLHTDVAGPEYLRDWHYPQPSGGLYHGRFTSAAQMNADRSGSVTGRYNPGGPRANLTPQAYVDGPTTLQAHPSLPTYDNQAAQPPNLPTAETNAFTGELFPPATLAQQLSPRLRATAANNASTGEFLPPATFIDFPPALAGDYVDMLLQT